MQASRTPSPMVRGRDKSGAQGEDLGSGYLQCPSPFVGMPHSNAAGEICLAQNERFWDPHLIDSRPIAISSLFSLHFSLVPMTTLCLWSRPFYHNQRVSRQTGQALFLHHNFTRFQLSLCVHAAAVSSCLTSKSPRRDRIR